MKKLLLLSALLIFACSSDEGNDDYDNNSNQTFLERYDGVVWEGVNDNFTMIGFFNSQSFMTIYMSEGIGTDENGNIDYCYSIGDYSDEISYVIHINSEDNFEYTEIRAEGDTYTSSFNVTNEGNELEASNDYDNETIYFVRTNLTEIPCN